MFLPNSNKCSSTVRTVILSTTVLYKLPVESTVSMLVPLATVAFSLPVVVVVFSTTYYYRTFSSSHKSTRYTVTL